jgi:hypothetical protein
VQSQCHQIAHIIGRTALKKYGSLSAAYSRGDDYCSSGYHHGVTEQAISDLGPERIKTQANDVCKEIFIAKPYSLDHHNCTHGFGHGVMAMEGNELFKALKDCDLLDDQWERSSCYGGVYMENVMVALRGDGTSKYLKKDELLYPCTAAETQYKDACYLNQSSYALQQVGYDFAKTFQICATADADFIDICYQSIGRDASGTVNSDIIRTVDNCNKAQNEDAKRNCMIGAAKDNVWYHHSDTEAKKLCVAFGAGLQVSCDQTVQSYYATF